LSSYTIGLYGTIALIAGAVAVTGDAPTDMSLAPDDLRLFQLLGATGEVEVFEVDEYAGTVVSLGVSSGIGLPVLGSQGIVAW
jgi:hypothetical protein